MRGARSNFLVIGVVLLLCFMPVVSAGLFDWIDNIRIGNSDEIKILVTEECSEYSDIREIQQDSLVQIQQGEIIFRKMNDNSIMFRKNIESISTDFKGVPAGEYLLEVSSLGYDFESTKISLIDFSNPTNYFVQLRSPESKNSRIKFKLPPFEKDSDYKWKMMIRNKNSDVDLQSHYAHDAYNSDRILPPGYIIYRCYPPGEYTYESKLNGHKKQFGEFNISESADLVIDVPLGEKGDSIVTFNIVNSERDVFEDGEIVLIRKDIMDDDPIILGAHESTIFKNVFSGEYEFVYNSATYESLRGNFELTKSGEITIELQQEDKNIKEWRVSDVVSGLPKCNLNEECILETSGELIIAGTKITAEFGGSDIDPWVTFLLEEKPMFEKIKEGGRFNLNYTGETEFVAHVQKLYYNSENNSGKVLFILETSFVDEEIVVCDGCIIGVKCYDFGYRKSGDFCINNKEWISQYIEGEFCQNNFECKSNSCLESKCEAMSIFQTIGSWFN